MRNLENNNIELKNKIKKNINKLPFSLFLCPKSPTVEVTDYKEIFADIILNRIQEKYKN